MIGCSWKYLCLWVFRALAVSCWRWGRTCDGMRAEGALVAIWGSIFHSARSSQVISNESSSLHSEAFIFIPIRMVFIFLLFLFLLFRSLFVSLSLRRSTGMGWTCKALRIETHWKNMCQKLFGSAITNSRETKLKHFTIAPESWTKTKNCFYACFGSDRSSAVAFPFENCFESSPKLLLNYCVTLWHHFTPVPSQKDAH